MSLSLLTLPKVFCCVFILIFQMNINDLLKQVAFIKEIDKLKYIHRRTKLFNSDRHENDAEHSWHLAVMTLTLAEHADKPINLLKVLKMVLIHDVVEID